MAHGLVKEDIGKDHPDPTGLSNALRLDVEMDSDVRNALLESVPYFDRQGVHEIYRRWRKIFDSYGDREVMAVAEAWVHPPINATRYVRADELHQVFNFDLLTAPFNSLFLFDVITRSIELNATVNALPTWALSNHDSPRVASRIGDLESQALAIFVFALPGSAYIFAGQELGLPDGELQNSDRQDPSFIRSKGAIKGRDGARVPLPWSGEIPPFGFTTGKPWLPLNQSWSAITIEKGSTNPDSVLNLYRKALSLRAQFLAGSGEIQWLESPLHGTKSSELLGFKRGAISVFMNLSHNDLVFDFSGQVLLSSTNGSLNLNDNSVIPARSTVWILN